MKSRIQQKTNVENNVSINTNCNITFTSSKLDNWEKGKFTNGDYFHTIVISSNTPYTYSQNCIFTVASEASNPTGDNDAATKVFGVIGSNGNTSYDAISYSEDYGTLYFFGNRYNAIIDNLESIYGQKAKTLPMLSNPGDYPSSSS